MMIMLVPRYSGRQYSFNEKKYALDQSGRFGNDKAFILPSGDPVIVATLNFSSDVVAQLAIPASLEG